MITVDTLNISDIRLRYWREYFDAGSGPFVTEGNGSSPTPPVNPDIEILTRDGSTILTRSGATVIARATITEILTRDASSILTRSGDTIIPRTS